MRHSTQPPKEEAPINLDRALGIPQAARILRGKRGQPGVCEATVRRWAHPDHGCPHPGGRVVLRTTLWLGERLTTIEWIDEFEAARLAATACACTPAHCSARPKRTREAAHRRACESLARSGIK